MSIFEKLLLTFISIATFNSVTFSNLYFFSDRIPSNTYTENYLSDAIDNEKDLLDFLFPTDDIDEDFIPPFNLNYTIADFQKFKGTYLTETDKASDSYFSDTVFLGDSLTYGLQTSGHIATDKTLASIGKGVYNILDIETVLTSGTESKKIIDWLEQLKPKKLYINLGTNGVESLSNEQHMYYYNKMLDRIRAVCPTTTIILVAIPPWSESRAGTASGNGLNTKINHFNMLLLETAKDRGMYFVNAAEALMNGKGALPDNYSGGDGLHWNYTAQLAYMNYLKTHTIYQ